MKNFNFWHNWLLVVGILISVFGVFIAFFGRTPAFDIFNNQINPIFWDSDAITIASQNFQGWMYAGWGSTIAGWGLMVIFIVHYAFINKARWAWNALAWGLVLWYLLDTGFSLYYSVIFNAFFNTGILILFALPLVFTCKAFK